MGAFRNKLLSSKVKQPTQFGFKLEKWDSLWADNNDPLDKDLYLAGKFIFEQLELARKCVSELYANNAPKSNYLKLLKLYCALSNRDATIALRGFRDPQNFKGSVFSKTDSSNSIGNELTSEEIAIGCVDGLELAISGCVRALEEEKKLPKSENPVDPIVFIEHEANISQTYAAYQDYWHSILYRGYQISGLESGSEIEISQPLTRKEIAYLISHTRRIRLSATTFVTGNLQSYVDKFDNAGIISITGTGENTSIWAGEVGKKPDPIRYKNTDFLFKIGSIIDELSPELVNATHTPYEFSINECMQAFRNLVFLADSAVNRFPINDEFHNSTALMEFCPTFKHQDLIKALVKSTGFTYKKVNKIVKFLTFSTEKNTDIWAAPLISLGSGKYTILVGAAAAPMLERVVERWLVKMGVDLTLKGTPFEEKIIEQINIGMKKCLYPDLICTPQSANVTLKHGKEQIDLIFKIGNLVVVGEIKSIVSTDSSVSFSHLSDILEGAAAQAKRKSNFINKDLKTTFERLKWNFEEDIQYQVIPIIINSNRVLVSYSIDDVPILDDKILQAYFVKGEFPLLSAGLTSPEHIAVFKIHETKEEFINNFIKYINNPPQALGDETSFEYKKVQALRFGGVKPVTLRRLVTKNFHPAEMLNRHYPFPVRTVDNIEKYLEEMAVII